MRPHRNLAVGDVVLMVTPNPKRNTCWPLGRIVLNEPGADLIILCAEVEVTRAHSGKKNRKDPYDVKTTASRYIPSAHKLCSLEADDSGDVFTDGENRTSNVTGSSNSPIEAK